MALSGVYQDQARHFQDELAVQFLPAVKAMAYRLKERLPSSIELNDLVAVGAEELVKLSRRYDSEQNDSFWGYAKSRVYGSMLDYLRSLDVMSRTSRRLVKRINAFVGSYVDRFDEEPDDLLIAEEIDEPVEKVREARRAAELLYVLPLEEQIEDKEDTFERVSRDELIEKIEAILATLPQRDQMMMQLYYFEELTYREIGEILGITPSRISQVHKRVVETIREALE